jgi:hypothetical protein
VPERRARGLEHRGEVPKHLLGLFGDSTLQELTGLGVDGNLTGAKNPPIDDDRL